MMAIGGSRIADGEHMVGGAIWTRGTIILNGNTYRAGTKPYRGVTDTRILGKEVVGKTFQRWAIDLSARGVGLRDHFKSALGVDRGREQVPICPLDPPMLPVYYNGT